ncbi:MAG: SDR family NAD(P)-dependent oxidoreductase [Halodesulfurarchaeum sp.]
MESLDLSGRSILVTGSANGIGRALVLALAENDGDVAVHYRTSENAARETTAAARKRGSGSVTTVSGDVTAEEEVHRLFDAVEDELGPVDVLINNVGAFAPVHWESLDLSTWNRVLQTNLTATFLCTKRALPAMREGGFGRVVNVGYASSERGLVNPTNFPFFAAKAGVLLFTRMVAADTQEDGITANAVSPYVVENSETFPDELPRGRPAQFEDIVHAVRFFLDGRSDYVSGANLEVDGGWLPESV